MTSNELKRSTSGEVPRQKYEHNSSEMNSLRRSAATSYGAVVPLSGASPGPDSVAGGGAVLKQQASLKFAGLRSSGERRTESVGISRGTSTHSKSPNSSPRTRSSHRTFSSPRHQARSGQQSAGTLDKLGSAALASSNGSATSTAHATGNAADTTPSENKSPRNDKSRSPRKKKSSRIEALKSELRKAGKEIRALKVKVAAWDEHKKTCAAAKAVDDNISTDSSASPSLRASPAAAAAGMRTSLPRE
jgi:hypothetical protein